MEAALKNFMDTLIAVSLIGSVALTAIMLVGYSITGLLKTK